MSWTEQKQVQVRIMLAPEVGKHLGFLAVADGYDSAEWLSKEASNLVEDRYDDWVRSQVAAVKEKQGARLSGSSGRTIDL